MRIPRLYTPQVLSESHSLILSEESSHYLKNVLRMKPGRELILFNGEGGEYQGVLESISKKEVVVSVGEYRQVDSESSLQVELGVCLIKNDAMDWLIQKAVELGVNCLYPLISDYTDVKLSAERIEKTTTLATGRDSCSRTVWASKVPVIKPVQKLEAWLDVINTDKRYILHPYQAGTIRQDQFDHAQSIALAVGPEGGFSEQEFILAQDNYQFEPLALGPRILRAETAPLAALAILQNHFGDL